MIKILNSYRLAYESNYLTDKVAEYFINNFEKIKSYNNSVIQGRDFFKKNLEKLGFQVIGGKANFLLINLKTKKILLNILKKFRDKKIYVKSNYTKELENCILITCGSKKTMQKIFNLIKETLKNEYNHYRR